MKSVYGIYGSTTTKEREATTRDKPAAKRYRDDNLAPESTGIATSLGISQRLLLLLVPSCQAKPRSRSIKIYLQPFRPFLALPLPSPALAFYAFTRSVSFISANAGGLAITLFHFVPRVPSARPMLPSLIFFVQATGRSARFVAGRMPELVEGTTTTNRRQDTG